MPLYEYQCDQCQHTFEKMVPFSQADSSPECPRCHHDITRRRISTIAARLTSSGGSSNSSDSSCSSGSRGRFT